MNFKNEIKKLLDNGFEPAPSQKPEENKYLTEIKESIIKLDKKQKEVAINIEDIQIQLLEALESRTDGSDGTETINTLISVIDYFDDFYSFASHDTSSPLFKQAEMMQNGILKKISAIGLTRIYDNETDFDSDMNTIAETESNPTLPNGRILETLVSGYTYNGNVVRKSKVIVVKN